MTIQDTVAVITGAAGRVGKEVAMELAHRGVHGLALVDFSEAVGEVAGSVNRLAGDWICHAYQGSVGDNSFVRRVYKETADRCGMVNVCVPAFGFAERDLFRPPTFGQSMASIQWALEMVTRMARRRTAALVERRHCNIVSDVVEGMIFFIQAPSGAGTHMTSVQEAALSRASEALMSKADNLGVGCAVMLPETSRPLLGRPARVLEGLACDESQPQAIARAICFLIAPAHSEKSA